MVFGRRKAKQLLNSFLLVYALEAGVMHVRIYRQSPGSQSYYVWLLWQLPNLKAGHVLLLRALVFHTVPPSSSRVLSVALFFFLGF